MNCGPVNTEPLSSYSVYMVLGQNHFGCWKTLHILKNVTCHHIWHATSLVRFQTVWRNKNAEGYFKRLAHTKPHQKRKRGRINDSEEFILSRKARNQKHGLNGQMVNKLKEYIYKRLWKLFSFLQSGKMRHANYDLNQIRALSSELKH